MKKHSFRRKKTLPTPKGKAEKLKEGSDKSRRTRSQSFAGAQAAHFIKKKILGRVSGSALEVDTEALLADDETLGGAPEEPLEFKPNRWMFKHKVGSGAFGDVWRSVYKKTQATYAVKKVRASEDADLEVKHEAEILQNVNHANLVAYYGQAQVGKFHWIVMELCDAGSLLSIMTMLGHALDEGCVSVVTRDIVAGLSYLHEQGYIHKDIKCGNILINSRADCKLSDFGVAQQIVPQAGDTFAVAMHAGGTLPFLAPEILSQNVVCAKSDVWALGMTILQMAEGENPYEHLPPFETTNAIISLDPPHLKEPNQWSSGLRELVSACLSKDLSERASLLWIKEHAFLGTGSREKDLLPLVVKSIQRRKELQEEEDRESRRALVSVSRKKSETMMTLGTPPELHH